MKETMFDVLMYLFENHMKGNCLVSNENTLMLELKQAGFDISEISNALEWLDGLSECAKLKPLSHQAFRILSPEEQELIPAECWGFILYLESVGILDAITREIVMDRLLDLNHAMIDLPQVKWVVLMVLFNQNDRKEALRAMESLVLTDSSEQSVH